jgi:hypothetical protein
MHPPVFSQPTTLPSGLWHHGAAPADKQPQPAPGRTHSLEASATPGPAAQSVNDGRDRQPPYTHHACTGIDAPC